MNADERRKLETSLIQAGFKGLTDPDLIPEFAKLITSHEILRALLNDCSRIERYQMLETIRPHLPFEANTVEWYENRTAEKFERYEAERNRIIAGDQEFERVCKELATHAVITLKCSACPKEGNYAGETPLGAVILARQDGWIRNRETNKECCPKHRPEGCPARRKCPGCQRRHFAPDCRVQGKVESLQHGDRLTIGGAKKGEMDVSTGMVN